MKKMILEELTKLYSNLGVSKGVLESQAALLAGMVSSELSDEEKSEKASELAKLAEPALKSIQSYADKRVSDIRPGKTKGVENLTDTTNDVPGTDPQIVELIKQMKETNDRMAQRIEALEGERTKKTREEMIASIAKEIGLTGEHLKFAKAMLSDEMDETAIRDSLGASKQSFLKMGMHTENDPSQTATEEASIEAEEKAWVEQFKASQVKQ